MNRYMTVCRLRWPALLLLTGVIALLNQMDLMSWGRAWPLYLILLGVLALAERAALANQPRPPSYPGAQAYGPGFAQGYAPGYAAAAPPANPAQPHTPYQPVSSAPVSTGNVPARTNMEPESSDSAIQPRKSWDEEGR